MEHNFVFHICGISYLKSKTQYTRNHTHLEPFILQWAAERPQHTQTHRHGCKSAYLFSTWCAGVTSWPLPCSTAGPDLSSELTPALPCAGTLLLATSHNCLKKPFEESCNNIFLKTCAIIFRLYPGIMQTPNLHLMGSKLF